MAIPQAERVNMRGGGELMLLPKSWERLDRETDQAWEAFEEYRLMGSGRSFTKLAEKLGKSDRLMEKWSSRHNWAARVLSWDRHEARIVNARIVMGTADMRQRQVNQALALQARAHARILKMSEVEIAALRPSEIVALMKVGSEIERRAREVGTDAEEGFGGAEMAPKFEVQVIRPGGNMVGVQLPDGRYGYIAREKVEDFKRDFPEAIVVV